jgi:general secretion pathway protein N
MSNARLALVFAALMLVFLAALLPLRLVLAGTGISARSAEGTLWRGQLGGAAWRGLALGDMTMGLAPLPLLKGQRRIDFATTSLAGSAVTGGGRAAADNWNGTATPGQIGGLPVARLSFSGFGTSFEDGRCVAAAGNLALEPAGPLAPFGSFSGTARCDGDRLLLPLQGQSGRLDLHLSGDGRYTARLGLDGVQPAARPALLAAGFQPTPTGLALTLTGQLL